MCILIKIRGPEPPIQQTLISQLIPGTWAVGGWLLAISTLLCPSDHHWLAPRPMFTSGIYPCK